MTELSFDFTAKPAGQTVLSTDGGGVPATCQVPANGGSFTYAKLGPDLAVGKYAFGNPVDNASFVWEQSQLGQPAEHWGDIIFMYNQLPTGVLSLLLCQEMPSGSLGTRIYINSNGNPGITDSTGAGSWFGSSVIPANKLVRLAWHSIHNGTTGSMECKVFLDPYSKTPNETISNSNRNTLSNASRLLFCFSSGAAAAGQTYWIQQIRASTTGYPPTPARPYPADFHISQHSSGLVVATALADKGYKSSERSKVQARIK